MIRLLLQYDIDVSIAAGHDSATRFPPSSNKSCPMQVCPGFHFVHIHMYYIDMYICGRPISLSAIILPAQWTFHYLSKLTRCTPFFSPSGPPCFSTPLLSYAPRAARDCPEGHILFLLLSYSAYATPLLLIHYHAAKILLHHALDFACLRCLTRIYNTYVHGKWTWVGRAEYCNNMYL